MGMTGVARRRPSAAALAATYAAIGCAWVAVSDRVVGADRSSTLKGLAFVAASGLIVFALVRVRDHRIATDEAARAQTEAVLRTTEERARSIVEAGIDVVITIDETGLILSANGAAERLLGWPPAELVGENVAVIAAGDHGARHDGYLARYLATGEARIIGRARELSARRRDGGEVPIELSVVEIPARGPLREFAGVIHDISDRVQYEAALLRGATHDELTGLPNRLLVRDRVGQALERAGEDGSAVAVVLIDIDRFADVNQAHGHAAGDDVLRTAGDRLAVVAGAAVARYGSDAFCVVLERLDGHADADRAAEQLVATFADPIGTRDGLVWCSASAGVAVVLAGESGPGPDALLRDADGALHRAKAQGGGRVEFFDEALRVAALVRSGLERELRAAVGHGAFAMAYQPQVELATGAVAGVEALLRWRRDGALALPATFIETAEASGLIVPIGRVALDLALADAARWHAAAGRPVPVSVNVSALQLRDAGFVDVVATGLARHGVPASALTIEITESALLDGAGAIDALVALAGLGARISVDDFGTHYASFTYLRRLGFVREIKLERQFAHGLARDAKPVDLAIVQAVIALAEGAGLRLVVEGVEDADAAERLHELGGTIAQGYHFARPAAAAVVAADIARRGLAQASC